MSGLRTYCSRCREEIPAEQRGRDGLCPVCLISEVVAPLKVEYQRLWAKRARYIAAGVNLRPVERQLAIVARRLGDKVHARISNAQQAIAILNAHLEDARNLAERGEARPRIILPNKPGWLLKASA